MVCFAGLLGIVPVQAATIYVSTAGNDGNNGRSWADAKKTVQAGLNTAAAGDQVWVAAGTYVENITLTAEVALYGGFAGTEADLVQRNWTVNVTVLDGNRAGSVVTAPSDATNAARIDGFTIRNGKATMGGGIYCDGSCAPTISNNTITENTGGSGGGIYCNVDSSPTIASNILSANTAGQYGGAIYIYSTSVTITSNTIRDNKASSGGGIYCYRIVFLQTPVTANTIENNAVANNTASSDGGGIYIYGDATRVKGNTISGNVGSTGGGIYSYYISNAWWMPDAGNIIENNTIVGNIASTGGGIYSRKDPSATIIAANTISGNGSYATGYYDGSAIYCYDSSPTIANNTLTNNMGGIALDATSSPTIVNTIVAYSSWGLSAPAATTATLRCNCIYGNRLFNYAGVPDPTGSNGNISVDPKLAASRYHDLHIQPGSPCVDAGDDGAVQAGLTDLDGQPRVAGRQVDIGADESDGTTWSGEPNLIVRVSPEGNDANDGSSWASSKRTVQAAIDAAASTAGDVWVKADTYQERILLRGYVHLYGGFAGTETTRAARHWAANATVLDAEQAGTVVTVIEFAPVPNTIDGFVIRNGKGSDDYWSESHGNGIYCYGASTIIENNTITGNNAIAHYGGHGGGIYCAVGSPTITNNAIAGNSAWLGGGIFCERGTPTIMNNRIVGNKASFGGGVYWGAPSGTLANNAIEGNSAATKGGGIHCEYTGATLANNVIVMNSSGISANGSTLWPSLRCNCVYGNTAYNYSGLTDPTGTNGNISADPRFVRPASDGGDGWGDNPATPGVDEGANDDYGDLHLLPGSPCIDAGSNPDVPADLADLNGNGDRGEPLPFDLAGGVRFADDPATADTGAGTPPIVDIGAYEYHCGDVSGDGHVDVVDLLLLAGAWGKAAGDSANNAACDFNSDGSVDVIDLLMLARNWGA